MSDYKVNTIGHWQGIEDTLKEMTENSSTALENIVNSIETEASEITTELVKLENGRSSASQQLTELETLITTTNSKLDSILTKLDSVIEAINTQGQAIVNAVSPSTT